MSHPHPTPDVPGHWPHLRDEVAGCVLDDATSRLLLRGLHEDTLVEDSFVPGHVCATTWVFDPRGEHILCVRHKVFGWSCPGGHLEPHETSRSGGLRELEEETGLTRFDVTAVLDDPALVHVSDLPGDRAHRHWNIAWLYTAEMDSPLSPVEGARWWTVTSPPPGPPDFVVVMERLLGLL